MTERLPIIIFSGPPGSGKGTVGQKLSQAIGIEIVAIGNIIRKEAETNSSLRETIDSGKLIPEEVTINIMKKHTARLLKDNIGFILDGFPRTMTQVEALKNTLSPIIKNKSCPIKCFLFDCSDEVILSRCTNRLTCTKCGLIYSYIDNKNTLSCKACRGTLSSRGDDTSRNVILSRINTFKETQYEIRNALQNWAGYNNTIYINANQEFCDVFRTVLKALGIE